MFEIYTKINSDGQTLWLWYLVDPQTDEIIVRSTEFESKSEALDNAKKVVQGSLRAVGDIKSILYKEL